MVHPPEPAPAPQIVTATFRVYNPETGEYEERPIPTLQTVLPSRPAESVSVPDAVVIPRAEQPAKKPAKKRSEMTAAEQKIDSFVQSAVSSAGRELGRTLSRSLLGVLGIRTTARRNTRKR